MTIRKIISPFILLLYLAASIGFGFYNCHCEHSDRLVLLTSDHCSCAHDSAHNQQCTTTGCSHTTTDNDCDDENGDCCKVVYKTIEIDQNEPKAQQLNKVITDYNLLAVLLPLFSLTDYTCQSENRVAALQAVPDYAGSDIIYLHRQLRL